MTSIAMRKTVSWTMRKNATTNRTSATEFGGSELNAAYDAKTIRKTMMMKTTSITDR